MNRPNPFASNSFFKPPTSFLANLPSSRSVGASPVSHRRSLSLDDSDTEAQRYRPSTNEAQRHRLSPNGAAMDDGELAPGAAVPLVDLSRSPSPYPRSRSAAQSDDEDESDVGDAAQSRPLVAKDAGGGEGSSTQRLLARGGVGHFLFGTGVGWRVYLGALVFWVGGCQFGTLLMERFILWTGTYKFPYPLTLTLLQLALTHLFLLASAAFTRGVAAPLRTLGLGAVVAPSQAYAKGTRPTRYTGGVRTKSVWSNVYGWLVHGSGGVAGGGLFEFHAGTAREVLPVAVVFLAKTVLGNISFAYAVMPMYMVSRIAVVPLTLVLTATLLRHQHSIQTLSSALIATLNLLMCSVRRGERDPWESVVAGVFSSLFVALYPILLLRSYRKLVSDLVPQGDLLSAPEAASPTPSTGTKEETRAYWRILHYVSLLSIAMLVPFVLVSGELQQIERNCYFLDVPWFWFLMACASLGGWAVFSSFLLLVKATSPLSANFVSVPRSVFQLAVLSKFKMPAHSWVGAGLCCLSCLWYALARAREGGRPRVGVS